MEIAYYPGCTMKTTGLRFEQTGLAILERLGVNAVELADWYCCGVMFSQTTDTLMHQLAPIRTLIKAKEANSRQLLTMCSMCYNTLKRAQLFVSNGEAERETINMFMKPEIDFNGDEVEVVHLLTLLEQIGADAIRQAAQTPVKTRKFAAYYGCLLTKPKAVSITEPAENPMILEHILTAAGFEAVYFPFKTECCASFQVVNRPEIVKQRAKTIVTSAAKNGAEVIVTSCPLCQYNLEAFQAEIQAEDAGFQQVPVRYFTELLAEAFGL